MKSFLLLFIIVSDIHQDVFPKPRVVASDASVQTSPLAIDIPSSSVDQEESILHHLSRKEQQQVEDFSFSVL